MQAYEINGVKALDLPVEGPALSSEQDAVDVIGSTFGMEVDLVVIPVERLHPDFLKLGNRMAGLFIQKFANYQCRVAFLGDISSALETSGALRDFVRESNKGGAVIFARDRDQLARLVR